MKTETLIRINKYWTAANFVLAIVVIGIIASGCGNPQSYIIQGAPGPSGVNGTNGTNGSDGTSCMAVPVAIGDSVLPKGGAIITCGRTSVLISNGTDGLNGINGTNGSNGANGHDGHDAPVNSMAIVEIIDPCGDAAGIDDEVFLHLANGNLIWLEVDNGSALTARLSQARNGSWQTTDGSGCNFTISTSGNQRTIAWAGGGKTWTME